MSTTPTLASARHRAEALPRRHGLAALRGIIATWREVTTRVQAEEALAASEALLRGAFDDAPVGALLVGFGIF